MLWLVIGLVIGVNVGAILIGIVAAGGRDLD
jgi:hypothetical protein